MCESDTEILEANLAKTGKPPGGDDAEGQFSLFRTYFDRKLDSLKREIILESQNSDSSPKRRKVDETVFKSKSNKIQFNFNSEILDLIDKAEKAAKFKKK